MQAIRLNRASKFGSNVKNTTKSKRRGKPRGVGKAVRVEGRRFKAVFEAVAAHRAMELIASTADFDEGGGQHRYVFDRDCADPGAVKEGVR